MNGRPADSHGGVSSQIPHDWKSGACVCTPPQLSYPEILLWLHRTTHHGSPKTPLGIPTRCPSFPTGAEPFARKERYLMPTLFYPGRGNSSVPLIRNPIGSLGGHSASRLSLCPCGRSPTMAGRTTGCLSAPVV